ncbi:hypothetical protein G5V65_11355 [Rhodobacter sp. HX-7-19]|uniref:Uncharacterized protein n=1 Tax=Paragemmobacter kunshanensis TaxID=2583234 RepID=A0A6M1U1Z7_9RHOB|nr:hypothetical protein [Rhodobacter kunshanensis]NGQ91494.1 hypothetical protein [Rhodobacter kunshanensis]
MDAPERIWACREPDWHSGETGSPLIGGNWEDHDFTGHGAEYVRADLCADPALLAEAVEVLRECHDALRDHGKQYPHMVKGYTLDAENRARAFIAKLENRHDR